MTVTPTQASLRRKLADIAWWAALSFVLHLVWESVHVRLYTLWTEARPADIARAVVHCTAGDVLIATTTFLLAALLLRTWQWPVARPLEGGAFIVFVTVVYTIWSEWMNLGLAAWAYTPRMPLVYGIGLTPLLQWLILPPLTILLYRTRTAALSRAVDYPKS